jgi:hypothetical protein
MRSGENLLGCPEFVVDFPPTLESTLLEKHEQAASTRHQDYVAAAR